MLVLTRKMDEQILIGNDIKITLVRVRGNSVRIGIEAPNEVRILRGELERDDSVPRSSAVAIPTAKAIDEQASTEITSSNSRNRIQPSSANRQVFVGSVRRNGVDVQLRRFTAAPLARFMMAQ